MSTYFKALETSEGQVRILTKNRWMVFVPMAHTSVMPTRGTDLKRLGTFIRWNTNDSAKLEVLHGAIVHLVMEIGISGLSEVANSARMTERVAKTFGRTWHDVVREAAQDGVAFPVPDEVLKYIKGFM